MKLLFIALFCLVISCTQKRNPVQNQQPVEVPEALTDSKSEISLVSKKRYDNNLVEELYTEMLQKDTSLKELERKINELKNGRPDSLSTFNNYLSKNDAYYVDAKNFTSTIKDSLLKKRIEEIITKSKATLENRIAPHKNIIHQIEKNDSALSDVHNGLIILSTLEVMEKYQKNNLPKLRPIQKMNEQFEKVLFETQKKLNSY